MSTQGPVKLTTQTALAASEGSSNVAINRQVEQNWGPAGIADRDIYPSRVFTKDLHLDTWLTVGDSVQLTDGCIKSNHVATDHAVITSSVQVGSSLITSDKISVPNLSSMSANLGSVSAGSIAVGTGGVVIGSQSGGIGIYQNKITAVYGGQVTVMIDGATGVLTCSKVNLTSDSQSSVNLSYGTHVFTTGIQVGSQTLGGMQTATSNAQSTANSAYNYAGSAYGLADTAYDYAMTAYSEATTRIKPGGGVEVSGQYQITRINTSQGIVVGTSAYDYGARTQITANGVAIYNSYGTLVVQCDHYNGIWVRNDHETPYLTERISVAYGSGERGYIYGYSAGIGIVGINKIYLSALDIDISSANDINFGAGALRARHKTSYGNYKPDTTIYFKDADGHTHTVVFQDGLIISWS